MLDLNRRSLIKGSVAAGVTALFGTAAQASTKVPAKWDETHDVVVIGSGFAGLAAAIEAKKAGASRFRGCSPPAKQPPACTVPSVWVPAPSLTAWSTVVSPARKPLRPKSE